MKEMLSSVTNLFTSDDTEEDTGEELDSSNPSAQTILDRMGDYAKPDHRRGNRRPNGSQELTPGRKKTLRENGWDGVQGTHQEEKYVNLRRLVADQKEAERQVEAHSGDRAQEFEDHAALLEERIQRQKKKIARAEA